MSRPWARIRGLLPAALSSLAAVAVALLAGALVILLTGDDPIAAYRALFSGAFGGRRPIAETLVAATPLIFGGLAFAIAARAGMFNIGIEGQMIVSGLASGVVAGWAWDLPAVLYLPIAVLAAMAAGGIWGAAPGVLKARFGSHEVITTIMLNYLAVSLSTWVIRAENLFPVDRASLSTNDAADAALLPNLLDGTRLHWGFPLAIVAAVFLWYVLFRTTLGYRVRAVGLSRGAAAYAGISWGGTIVIAMLASGLFAGLAGAGQTLGLQGRYVNVSPGYGFTAIAVGLVGRNHPLGVIVSGILFGAITSGATRMQNTAGTSKEIVQVLQGLVILSVAAFVAFGSPRLRARVAARFGRGPKTGTGGGGTGGSDRAAAVGMTPLLESQPEPPRV